MKKQPPVHRELWERLDWGADRSAGWLGCWPWDGNRDDDGYGRVRWETTRYRVHRLVYEIAYGPVAAGLVVCHSCDHPWCCNPAHLWLGTVDQNNLDRTRKRRELFGDKNPAAVLTEDEVKEIRRRFDAGEIQAQLAREFEVSPSLIRWIGIRHVWVGVEP